MKRFFETLSLILLPLSSILLIGLQFKLIGFVLLFLGIFSLFFCSKTFRKDLLLVYISLGILGMTPISTDISASHSIFMAILLTLVLLFPYLISRYIYKDHLVRFHFRKKEKWTKVEISYIFLTGILSYFIFPFMLLNTGSYQNWHVYPGAINLLLLFIGTNALGIWDELFFINTVLGILRKHSSFPIANFIQAILFTSFLYELGFRGWAFLLIFFFALLQGIIFKKTNSLLYIIAIHLTADFILYLALIYTHYPTWMPIFIR
jgi:membrane protease YdiL (CAAX protease family)